MNNTQYEKLETKLEQMFRMLMNRMDRLESEVKSLPYEDEPETKLPEDDIYALGQRVPYNRLDGKQIEEFRKFLYHIRMNSSDYTEREVEFAGYADKTFEDIRLSENSKRILEGAYFKTYKKAWPFQFVRGYLHKLEGDKAWSWSDGSKG